MRVFCSCGEVLTNQSDPNDTEYYVYCDNEWSVFQMKDLNVMEIPFPSYNVWHCKKCGRLIFFDNAYNIKKIYCPEQ